MLVLVISGVFGLLFAMKLFRWEKEERISGKAKLWSGVFVLPFLVMGLWMNTRANPTAMWARSFSVMGQAASAPPNPEAEQANLIESFEGIQASEELLRRWQVSTDSDVSGHSLAEISLVTPGAEGTRHAMRLKGHLAPGPENVQGHISARCEVRVPAGSKGLRGIEFEARGASRLYQVAFHPSTSTTSPVPSISFVPGKAWQNVRLPIAWLSNFPDKALAAGPWVLEVSVTGPAGEFTLDLDEIRFY
jgi:hypothetical protein